MSKVPSGDGWLGPSEVAPSDVGRLVLLAGTGVLKSAAVFGSPELESTTW